MNSIYKFPHQFAWQSKSTWLFLLAFSLIGSLVHAQITGAVFRDFNGNGIKDTNEPLTPGITVRAYNTTGTLCGTATTSGNTAPNYSLTGCGTGDVRVEFVLPNNGICVDTTFDSPALGGTTYGTSVQFVKGNSTNINFGFYNPADYNTGAANTMVYVPCYVHGDPTAAGGTSGPNPGLWGIRTIIRAVPHLQENSMVIKLALPGG